MCTRGASCRFSHGDGGGGGGMGGGMNPMMMQQMQQMQGSMGSAVSDMKAPPPADPNATVNSITGDGLPVEVRGVQVEPCKTFEEADFPPQLLASIKSAGFPAPSPIQQYCWPVLSKGMDAIGIAKTGSGKTLGFLMPAFTQILRHGARGSPAVLVMAPTRELAMQIVQESLKFGMPCNMRTVAVYGGAPKGDQLRELRMQPQVVVGTPGRLNDFLEGMQLNLGGVTFLILDEADRMLDMGFEPQIRKIIDKVPRQRQTMMFSATWPTSVRRLASEFMRGAAEIRIGNCDSLQANTDISQEVVMCGNQMEKQAICAALLNQNKCQTIVFCGTKRMCDQLCRMLNGQFRAESIHGDKNQRERDAALAAFKANQVQVLCATDVAARGLDVKGVKMVINFDPAGNAEDYVHRIGRTGRAGEKGLAVSLLTNQDGIPAQRIAECIKRTGLPIPASLQTALNSGQLSFVSQKGGGKGGGFGRR
jgi:ATP-dependent RNA helicase DDX5/DBP2